MKTRIVLLSFCAASLLCADQVVLKNGDTITGSVVKKDGGNLTFKSEFLGEISIPWAAVKSLNSDQELVVVLPGGESVRGKIATTGDRLDIAGATPKSAPLADVSAMRNEAEQKAWERVQHPGILQLWAGSYDLGLALARGNARAATLTNNFVATRVTKKDKVMLHLNQIWASALANNVNSTTASAIRGGWAYNRDLNPKIFLATINEYEHDRFQNLDLRAVFGGGAGWNAVKSDRANFSVQAGGDYEMERFMNHTDRNSAEINFGDDFLYKFSKVSSVTQAFRMYPNMSQTGEYRLTFDLTATTALKKWLGWQVSVSDRFLSNPAPGRLRNDVLLSTGFRVTFAQ